MKILVTGGAGFIGSNFIKHWLKNYPEDQIVNLDKLTYAANLKNLEEIEHSSNYEFVKGDICDLDLVKETSKNVDTIVHFAAESHVDRSIEGPQEFVYTNINGTLNLLEAARERNTRFHFISTDEVFGELPIDKPKVKFDENSKLNPRSPYSASKAGAEHLVRAYFNTYKIPVTISNCSNNYGPFHHPEKLIPLAITRALMDQEIPVYGNGLQVRDWIYVEDHCKGIDLILKKGQIGETYLLGGGSEKTNLWIIKKILELTNKSENLIVHVGDRKGHDLRYAIDYSKAEKELGFLPNKNIDEYLQETVKWYIDHEDWWKPLKADADKIAETYLSKRL